MTYLITSRYKGVINQNYKITNDISNQKRGSRVFHEERISRMETSECIKFNRSQEVQKKKLTAVCNMIDRVRILAFEVSALIDTKCR